MKIYSNIDFISSKILIGGVDGQPNEVVGDTTEWVETPVDKSFFHVEETSLAPAIAGSPTPAEIEAWVLANGVVTEDLIYTGTDVSSDPIVKYYKVDKDGRVSPAIIDGTYSLPSGSTLQAFIAPPITSGAGVNLNARRYQRIEVGVTGVINEVALDLTNNSFDLLVEIFDGDGTTGTLLGSVIDNPQGDGIGLGRQTVVFPSPIAVTAGQTITLSVSRTPIGTGSLWFRTSDGIGWLDAPMKASSTAGADDHILEMNIVST